MTVCVGVKVYNCIVFAADSASTLMSEQQPGTVANIWEHGIKVFNLHKKLPVVAMTCGMGNFGPASISNLTKDLRLLLMGDGNDFELSQSGYSIEEVTGKAHDFFKSKFDEMGPHPANSAFDFWIGGYGSNDSQGEVWKFSIIDGIMREPIKILTSDQFNLFWGGMGNAIDRLIFGSQIEPLQQALRNHQIAPDVIDSIINEVDAIAMTPLANPAMPVQDAINLVDFLVDLTKKYFSFLPLANIVGGDTDIATVTKHEGFKWIKRKHYYPASLNPTETDHVGQQPTNQQAEDI